MTTPIKSARLSQSSCPANERSDLQAPDNDRYEVSWIDIYVEKLENYNWNLLDFYTCTRGDRDYPLISGLKFWRIRLYVLPSSGYKELSKYVRQLI